MKFLVPIALFVFAGFMTFKFVMILKSDAVREKEFLRDEKSYNPFHSD